MSTTSEYTFFGMANVGEDSSCLSQRNVQNTMACNYTTQNYFEKDSTMRQTRQLATSQPGIMYNGSKQTCPGGTNIIESTKLRHADQDRANCKIDLFMRPYVTVPCLRRGYGNAILEAELQQGEQVSTKKKHNDLVDHNISLTETNYSGYNAEGLMTHKQLAPVSVDENREGSWVRGGVSSRDLSKDTNKYVTYN